MQQIEQNLWSGGQKLSGKRVIIAIANGYHEHEFWFPFYRFKEEGAEVIVAGPKTGTVQGEGINGKDGLKAHISHSINDLLNTSFDLLYLPGGIFSPLELRNHTPMLDLVRRSMNNGTAIAAICHAPWILISAGVIQGFRITSPLDMSEDVKNAGGLYEKEKCVRDRNLVTAEYYSYLPEQFQILIPMLMEQEVQQS